MRKDKQNPRRARAVCGDCGVREGELHILGCDMEDCPFCGQQLITCDCCYEQLGLFDTATYDESTASLPSEVYHHGLTTKQAKKWEAMLNAKGRIPFILYPVICSKCGALWPAFFMVSDEEWAYYIQPDKRRTVICAECYHYIKQLIDETKGPLTPPQPRGGKRRSARADSRG
ncbi:MAG TPA: hypothetical protein VFD70_08170 [Anaerolineae bacterium]|nr:hypothetical protein [Anaerolineae bacterium]